MLYGVLRNPLFTGFGRWHAYPNHSFFACCYWTSISRIISKEALEVIPLVGSYQRLKQRRKEKRNYNLDASVSMYNAVQLPFHQPSQDLRHKVTMSRKQAIWLFCPKLCLLTLPLSFSPPFLRVETNEMTYNSQGWGHGCSWPIQTRVVPATGAFPEVVHFPFLALLVFLSFSPFLSIGPH